MEGGLVKNSDDRCSCDRVHLNVTDLVGYSPSTLSKLNEPRHEKTNILVSDLV